jgi:sorbitol-specific phosphotransferase system component IIBC
MKAAETLGCGNHWAMPLVDALPITITGGAVPVGMQLISALANVSIVTFPAVTMSRLHPPAVAAILSADIVQNK